MRVATQFDPASAIYLRTALRRSIEANSLKLVRDRATACETIPSRRSVGTGRLGRIVVISQHDPEGEMQRVF